MQEHFYTAPCMIQLVGLSHTFMITHLDTHSQGNAWDIPPHEDDLTKDPIYNYEQSFTTHLLGSACRTRYM